MTAAWANYIVSWAIGLLFIVLLVVWIRESRSRRREGAKQLEQAEVDMQAAASSAADLTGEVVDLREQIDRERKLSAEERRQRQEINARIGGILAERDSRTKLYYEQAAAHANAQSMMLRERERISVQFTRLRMLVLQAKTLEEAQAPAQRDLQKNPAIEQVAADFRETHIEPNREQITSGLMPG